MIFLSLIEWSQINCIFIDVEQWCVRAGTIVTIKITGFATIIANNGVKMMELVERYLLKHIKTNPIELNNNNERDCLYT